MFDNLTNDQLLNDMQLDLWIHSLRRVGRRNMTAEELWRDWLGDV